MRKLAMVLLALVFGCAAEAALCGVGIVSLCAGGFEPCGPTGDPPGWLVFVHQPGIWLAETFLPRATLWRLPTIVSATALQLSAVAFLMILAARAARRRQGPAGKSDVIGG